MKSVAGLTLAALVLGLAIGALVDAVVPGMQAGALAVADPLGGLWLDALKMTTVPLVFALLVSGIAAAAGAARAGGLAARTVVWFTGLLVLGALLGLGVTAALLAIWPVPGGLADAIPATGALPVPPGVAEWLRALVPANPVKAAADGNMLQVVVFAMALGFALLVLDADKRARLTGLMDALADAMLVIVGWVIRLAPLGVAALAFGVGARAGAEAAGTLLHYCVVVSLASAVLVPVMMALAWAVAGVRPRAFLAATMPALTLGFGTQSSLATLPLMVDASRTLGVAEANARTILPMAVAMFRMTSPAANLSVALYCGAIFGVHVGVLALVAGVVVAVAISLSAISLPSQITFFVTLVPICTALGVPLAALPLLIAVETIPDLFRTIGNVAADVAVAVLAGRDG
jgi:Na+/H+-dicarboxylate symporter